MDAGPVLVVYFLFAILAIGMVVGLGRLANGRATGVSNAVFIASGVLLVVFTIRLWPLLGIALLGLLGFGIALMARSSRKGR